MSMTDEQVRSRLSAIRRAADDSDDIRFLLAYIDGANLRRRPAYAEYPRRIKNNRDEVIALDYTRHENRSLSVCSEHEWPYGFELDGDCRPSCVWCEALRADALERKFLDAVKLIRDVSELLVNATPNAKLLTEEQQREWTQKFGAWYAGVAGKHVSPTD